MTVVSASEARANLFGLIERVNEDAAPGSSLLVWCSFGQVVMGGRAARPPSPPVLLSVWSMSVRCRSEVWER